MRCVLTSPTSLVCRPRSRSLLLRLQLTAQRRLASQAAPAPAPQHGMRSVCCTYRPAFSEHSRNNVSLIVSMVDARWRSYLPVQLTRSRPRVPKTLWTNTVMTTQRQTSAGAYVYNMHYCYSAEPVTHCSWPVGNMLARHGLCPMLSLLSHVAVTCRVYED